MKKHFIDACFADDLQKWYSDWIEEKKDRIQFFTTDDGYRHRSWLPSDTCCYSGEKLTRDNIDVLVGYWTPFMWKPIRKDLRVQAQREEAYECQLIDCSCNDCAFLKDPIFAAN